MLIRGIGLGVLVTFLPMASVVQDAREENKQLKSENASAWAVACQERTKNYLQGVGLKGLFLSEARVMEDRRVECHVSQLGENPKDPTKIIKILDLPKLPTIIVNQVELGLNQ